MQGVAPVPSEGLKVQDTTFAGVPVRVYESRGGEKGGLRRGLVYLHGGGWALASTSKSHPLL